MMGIISMKRPTILLLAFLTAIGVTAGQKSPARQLLERLKKLQKRGVMMGHQDDPFYGTTWKWDYGKSDVKAVCGQYPAVMGFELGKIELGSDKNLDGVPFDREREEIRNHYRRGGIITISWHPTNPVTGGSAWDPQGNAVAAVLPGGAQHVKMQQWLDTVIAFLKSLTTTDGKPIPVIFRPWHEMTGNWFWWGSNSCTPAQYQQLYRMTVERIRQAGLTNIVYSYSPGADAKESLERYGRYYPGDDVVDILGTDIYQYGTNQEFIDHMQLELKVMTEFAKSHHKLVSVSETGYRNTPDPQWFTSTLLPAIRGYRFTYFLLWRNAWDQKEENFGPAPDKSCAADFQKLASQKRILLIRDIQ